MPPTKFQIYVDESVRQPPENNEPQPQQSDMLPHKVATSESTKSRCVIDLAPNQKFPFNPSKIYPETGNEFSFEELYLLKWRKNQQQGVLRKRILELEKENNQLRDQVEVQEDMIARLQKHISQTPTPTNSQPPLSYPLNQQPNFEQNNQPHSRLSIVPQNAQPTGDLYGAQVEFPTVVHDWDTSIATRHIMAHAGGGGATAEFTRNQTLVHDKFTVPINNSQYIKENLITSTPSSKDDASKRPHNFNRRKSRPSLSGSPTLKLSPITETSRECNSKSSSSTSSSALATVKKAILAKPIGEEEEQEDKPMSPEVNPDLPFKVILRDLFEEIDMVFEDHSEAVDKTIQTVEGCTN